MTITDPMTMVTDYLLALACAAFAVMTFRLHSAHPAVVFWILAFTFGAIAALLGGTHHGFKTNFGVGAGKGLWDFTMISIGASTAFLAAATIASGLRHGQLEYVSWLKWGIAVSAAGFVIQKAGWDIHHNFNHNDLFHIVQIAGFWCFYEELAGWGSRKGNNILGSPAGNFWGCVCAPPGQEQLSKLAFQKSLKLRTGVVFKVWRSMEVLSGALPSWPGGRTERLQATLRSIHSARRVVGQIQQNILGLDRPPRLTTLRMLREIS